MRLAARGQRDLDDGPNTIGDEAELRQVRRQARRVHLQAVAFAALLTAALALLPVR